MEKLIWLEVQAENPEKDLERERDIQKKESTERLLRDKDVPNICRFLKWRVGGKDCEKMMGEVKYPPPTCTPGTKRIQGISFK